MTPEEPGFVCRNCRLPREGKADRYGWCAACRQVLVRRTILPAGVATFVVAAGLLALQTWLGVFGSRFMMGWLALAGIVSFGAWKVARRVAFEVMQARSKIVPEE